MNVLLAGPGVPYDLVLEMEQHHADFATNDVVLVIGRQRNRHPRRAQLPPRARLRHAALECWKSEARRSCSSAAWPSGYAGVEHTLFYLENTRMLFATREEHRLARQRDRSREAS